MEGGIKRGFSPTVEIYRRKEGQQKEKRKFKKNKERKRKEQKRKERKGDFTRSISLLRE